MTHSVHRAGPPDAADVARLLHDFNTEFDTPSPGIDRLPARLGALLRDRQTIAVLAGSPPIGVAFVTLRTNVWFTGPVALLDELYVAPTHRNAGVGTALVAEVLRLVRQAGSELLEINVDEGDVDARRFYERHGFTAIQPETGERALYYVQELDT